MNEAPRRPFRRWANRAAFINLLGVAGLVVWFFTAADEHWLATLMLFGPRWLAFAPLALLLPIALISRSLWGLVWCVAAAVIIAWPFMGASFNVNAEPAAHWRIITFNADNKDCDRVLFQKYLNDTRPDVLALEDADRIREADLPGDYKLVSASNGIKLAARQAVTLLGDFSDPRIGPARGAAKFRVGERVIGVVHLPTPRLGLEAILARKPDAVETLERITAQRGDASKLVRDWLGDCPLVVGDFNLPVESLIYRRDWADFTNAFSDRGLGYGWTMYSRRGSVRIDHVLFKQMTCLNVTVGPDLGSAHRPVVADFSP